MWAACCSLLGRSLFVTVAAPLVLLGSVLLQVSIDLEVQSLQNLRYAVGESALATGTEEEAARDVGEAALDQTEAEILENEAQGLDAAAASATADEAAESATGAAASGAEEEVSELSEQVKELASDVAEGLEELPAAESGLEVAGEAAVDAVGATATGVAAPSLAADAVLAGVAGTVAEEGPKVVAAAKEEWAVGSEELQAANDQRMAIEKEVQATALEADVPVLEAGALGAEEAAYGSLLTAAGYLSAATVSQLAALAMQVPVLTVVATQWIFETQAKVLGGLARTQETSGHLRATELAAQVSLYLAVATWILTPWANVVVMAATLEEMGDEAAQQLLALPKLLEKAMPIFQKHEGHAGSKATPPNPKAPAARKGAARRLWDWPKEWVSNTVGEAEGALDSIAKHTEEAASDLEHRTKEVVDDIKKDGIKVIKDLSNATKKVLEEGEASADQGVKEATDAAREGAIKVVKGLVFRPNTLTTTVAPLRLTPAPVALPYQHFLSSGASMLLHSVLYWLQPVVTDLLLISLAFLIFELTMSLGRHGHRYHQGSYGGPFGLLEAAGNVCMELWSGWTFGLAILVALWVVGILFAKELRTSAEPFQAGTPQAASLLLGLLCATLSVYFLVASWRWKAVNDHADIEAPRLELTRNVEEEEGPPSSRGPSEAEDDKPLLERPERQQRSLQISYAEKLESEEPSIETQSLSLHVARSVASFLVALMVTAVTAFEGPLVSAAVGSSYKAAVMSYWMWGLVPWREIDAQVFHHRLILLALAGLSVGCLIGVLLFFLRRAARESR